MTDILLPRTGAFKIPYLDNEFERLYSENSVDSHDDSAVVNFLKNYTGFTNLSGKTPREERRALELAFLSDLADNAALREAQERRLIG